MYLNFFDLDELPFNLTPDPKFFFMSKGHSEAVEHLDFGIEHRQGFIVITGEVGSGKTTVCRALLSGLDSKKVKTALILNPMLSPLELLQAINEDLGLEYVDNSRKRLTKLLNEYLLEQFSKGSNVAVIIDEAQNLSDEALEQIRLLSNLETSKDKLIQIILLGQPELAKTFSRSTMAPLAQRIAVRYHLGPLDFAQSCQYVAHRMQVAGCHQPVFTKGALKRMFRYSGGIPRKINLVCDKALLCAYGIGEIQAGSNHMRSALLEIGRSSAGTSGRLRRALAVAAAVVLVSLVAWYVTANWFSPNGVRHKSPQTQMVFTDARVQPADVNTRASKLKQKLMRNASGFDENGIYRVDQDGDASFGAVVTLLRLWGQDVDGLLSGERSDSTRADADVWAMIGRSGFRIESRRARIGYLRLLDVPCLIQLRQSDRSLPKYCAVVGLDGDVFRIADPVSGLLSLQETDIDKRWTRRAVYILPDLAGLGRTLRFKSRGPDVVAFRARLFNLGLLGESKSDRFDAECARAVREFQLLSGLVPDGIAGWRTMVVLTREIMVNKAPRLSTWPSQR